MKYALLLPLLALACGCSSDRLDQTWPDGSRTQLYTASLLKERKINNAIFVRKPDGTVIVTVGEYANQVNAKAVGSAMSAIVRLGLIAAGIPL